MSGGSSLKDTDFSNDTDLSGIDVDQCIFGGFVPKGFREAINRSVRAANISKTKQDRTGGERVQASTKMHVRK